MKRTLTTTLLALTAAALALVQPSRAQDTKMIDTRAQTIAKGDVAAIMADYAAEPVLHWIGGPLAGEYKGMDAIKGVWTKFTTAQAPLTVKVSGAHAMGSDTLMAETAFTGAKGNMIPVLLTERTADGKITEETWKVNAPAAAPSPAKAP